MAAHKLHMNKHSSVTANVYGNYSASNNRHGDIDLVKQVSQSFDAINAQNDMSSIHNESAEIIQSQHPSIYQDNLD